MADISAETERNHIVSATEARPSLRRLSALLAAVGLVAVLAVPTLGASVVPTPINDGNPTCGDFNASWTELKIDPPGNGVFTDGTLTVTITAYVNSSSGTPGSFNWTSNIGVDAVFVKAGDDKHNLYVYNPESLGDTGLGPQAGSGNGISHISFCYDADAPPSESVPASQPSVPASQPSVPASQPSVPASQPSIPASNPPSGGVEEETGTPGITPPSTSTDISSTGSTSNGWLIPILGIALLLASLLLLTPSRTVRRRR